MTAAYIRFENQSTSLNALALCNLLRDDRARRVLLFASSSTAVVDNEDNDAKDPFPLMSALVEYELPAVLRFTILFDGLFLTAARMPRIGEVTAVLDAATASGRAFFASQIAPFTHGLEPQEAAKNLLGLGPFAPLDAATRPTYFAQLALIPEASI